MVQVHDKGSPSFVWPVTVVTKDFIKADDSSSINTDDINNLCEHCLQLVCLYHLPPNRKNNLLNEVLQCDDVINSM